MLGEVSIGAVGMAEVGAAHLGGPLSLHGGDEHAIIVH